MVAMTSLIRSTGMSPTTRGLLFSSWGRGSEGLRFSPAAGEEKKKQPGVISDCQPAVRPLLAAQVQSSLLSSFGLFFRGRAVRLAAKRDLIRDQEVQVEVSQ